MTEDAASRHPPGLDGTRLQRDASSASRIRLLVATALPFLVVLPASAAGDLVSPRPGEVFFGAILASAPAGADTARLYLDGRLAVSRRVAGRQARFRLTHPPGRYDLAVRFERDGRVVGGAAAKAAWLLGRSSLRARRERRVDGRLSARLAALGRAFPGYAAFWVHDLSTGRTARWNSDARFPAASTVKLGVLLAALRRFGPLPERSVAWRDLRDLATWSSNVASNRLLIRLGGSERAGARIAQDALWRAGARSSTFTGNYRLGTSAAAPAADAPRQPPFLAWRRTTAHDLGRVLFELHAAALGNRLSLRRTGLSRHEARLGLALLLSSDSRGASLGLLRPSFPRGVPMAQKQGWTTSLRHTAAVVYAPRGPVIGVILTYRPGLSLGAAAALGRRFAALLRDA